MIDTLDPKMIVTKVSAAAAAASGRCPRPLRSVLDRTLVDMACLASGGLDEVARSLRVDVPAVDAWRELGVPGEFRAQLHAMSVVGPRTLRLRRNTPEPRLPVAA